ncbi:MAG: hypothetical protein NTZ90_10355 [Proteobacteria bacterium]|jgi:phage FluMu protein Com|nr:hypothetical protein [Pseudomonadota bacterium]
MSSKFHVTATEKSGEAQLSFAGVIDEDVDFTQIKLPECKVYTFNFDGVKGINSCGIREWVHFSESLPAAAKLVYQNCTQIIIEQINMVAGFFRAGSEVQNFYAPYFCESCDREQKVLITAAAVAGLAAPSVNCPECKAEMEFDAIEEQYFRFLKASA